MDKTYSPADIERRWYAHWESLGAFAPRADAPGGSYCIMIPPPNVTGTLHMGHAFQDTIMDALTRYHRMRGEATLWQPGTDHAGIATQMLVERQLNAEGKQRTDLGREKFIERVWEWKRQSGGSIAQQLRRLGASVDWSRDRFTMDPGLSQAVTEVFVRLYEEQLIYRGQRLVNWDPVLRTALSDLEVLSEEETGSLWYLRYPLSDGSGTLTVATTRPETMIGDTAVAVHPTDERYLHLVGRMIRLPLTNREIPVIADEYVDPAFGTGCVKITPAHDFNDYAVGQRHAPAADQRVHARRAAQRDRAGAAARPGSLRGAQAHRRAAQRRRTPRAGRAAQAHGAARRSQRRRGRALPHRPVVRARRAARGPGDRGRGNRPHPLRAGQLGQDLLPVDAQHPGLVHQPPAVVGASHPGLVRRRRQHLRRARRGGGGGTGPRPPWARGRAAPGRGRARHLVLLGAVAVLDPGLARRSNATWRASTPPACW